MKSSFPEPNGGAFDAHLYTLLHTGNDGDVDFYVGLCADARSVLELGCGAGRILAQLTAPQRVGVDLHAAMIERARAAVPGAALHVGDMRTLDLGARFERVILPYNTLYCVPDDAGAIAVLQVAAKHLAPGGLIAFDGYQVSTDPEDLTDDDAPEWIATLHDADRIIEVYEEDRHWPARRDCAVRYVFESEDTETGSTARSEDTLRHHYQHAEMIWDLLADAGLRCVAMWGEFDQSPVEDGERLVVLATHAED
ncbi:MAG: SAM-dependent methyltransferase [Bradymonadia bacterium]|jgi:SAM-dependent methyltransferase